MKLLKNPSSCLLAPIFSLVVFCIIFQIWKVDLTLPAFSYNNDGLFSIFIIKNIISSGWFMCSDNIGLPHLTERFCLYDFPMESDMFHIIVIKFITLFSDNPFLVANLFFISTFVMTSATAFIALRQFKVSIFTATIIGVLYAFVPYHFTRNVWHLFLSNYMIIPLSVMVGLWIAQDKIAIFYVNAKNQYAVRANKYFLFALLIAILVAGNNVYYAYYSCIIFMLAWFLRGLRSGVFFGKGGFEPIILCGATFVTSFYLYLPTLFYQLNHGFNPYLAGRGVSASEVFGLKIIDLFMPVANHHISYFSNLRLNFDDQVVAGWERMSESLGLLGSIGFLFLFVWLFGRNFRQKKSLVNQTIKQLSLNKNERDLISYLAEFNIFGVLFSTVGGLVMFLVLPFPTLRSHARFAIFIAFISLFIIAIIFDKLIEKKLFGKKLYAQIAVVIVMIFGIFDQVGRGSSEMAQASWIKDKYYSDSNFIKTIENSVPPKSMIFILPSFGFPENVSDDYHSVIAYAHSKNLRWSYPVVAGREGFFWQQRVMSLNFGQFIKEIKAVGFVGVYLDEDQYRDQNNTTKLMSLKSNLKSISKTPPMISKNKKLIFYQI